MVKFFKSSFLPLLAFSVGSIPVNADTLTTGTTAGNRHQEYNIFDVKALKDTTITGFQQNFGDIADYKYEVWFKEGSAAGTVPDSSVWKKIGTASSQSILSGDRGQLTTITFDSDFALDIGSGETFGFLVGGDTNHNDLLSEVRSGETRQTSSTGAVIGNVLASDDNLQIFEGTHASTNDGIDNPNTPYYYYNWNGALVYTATPTINSNSVKPYGYMQKIAINSINSQRENILSQAGECFATGLNISSKTCAFANISNRINEVKGTYGFDVDNLNSSLGIEKSFGNEFYAGIAYGSGTSNLSNYSIPTISASIDSSYNLYSAYLVKNYSNNFRLKTLIGFADFEYDGKRYKNHSYADSDYKSDLFTSEIRGIWDIKSSSKYSISPTLGFAYSNNSQSSFNETGSTHLFSVEANESESYLINTGIKISKKFDSSKPKILLPKLEIKYSYDLAANNDKNRGVKAKLTNGSASSTRHLSEEYGEHTLDIKVGADKLLTKNLTLSSNISYSLASNANGYSYEAGFNYRF